MRSEILIQVSRIESDQFLFADHERRPPREASGNQRCAGLRRNSRESRCERYDFDLAFRIGL
jgi:hypothetical protein